MGVGVWAARQGPLTSGVSQNHHEGVGSRLAVGMGARHTQLDPKQSGRGPGGELGNQAGHELPGRKQCPRCAPASGQDQFCAS